VPLARTLERVEQMRAWELNRQIRSKWEAAEKEVRIWSPFTTSATQPLLAAT
jgi:hypothetical protein